MSAILNSAILDSAILVFPLKLTHTCQDWFPPFAQKNLHSTLPSPPLAQKNLTHSFRFNLLMVAILISAILNSAILDSASALWNSNTLFSSLRFIQKHPPSTLTLTQTNSIWLKLIQSDSNSFILTQLDDVSHLEFGHLVFIHLSFSSQTHSYLPRLVPTICTK